MRALLSGSILGALLAGAVAAVIYAVPPQAGSTVADDGSAEAVDGAGVRPVRVLIGSGVERIRVRAASTIQARSTPDTSVRTFPADNWMELTASRGGILKSGDGSVWSNALQLNTAANLYFVSFSREGDGSYEREYPGLLRVIARDDARLDVINEVDLEPYVACVTAGEIWPTFHVQARRAQAIAARSYVLYQMSRRNQQPFDVSATQGSQIYRGLRRDSTGERAAEAARYTRGVVLTWHDGEAERLFCTYYSAACGGVTQSAALFGPEGDIPPLAGGVRCDYCRMAPGETYRWGPVRIDWSDLRHRLLARYPELESWGSLRSIQISEKTKDGRALTIRITGSAGETLDLLAERFRHALGAGIIRSSAFSLEHDRHGVVFSDGKGFGHGLGLCQWGMEGQARQGRLAGAILQYYYPGARMTRVY